MEDNFERFEEFLDSSDLSQLDMHNTFKGTEVSYDEMLQLLSNSRRRFVLAYMDEFEEPYELRSITNALTCFDQGKMPQELRSSEKKKYRVSLYQHHIPKLDNAEVVEYDRTTDIYKGENFELFSNYGENFFPDIEAATSSPIGINSMMSSMASLIDR